MRSCNDFVSVVTAPDWTINGPNLLDEHMYGSDAFFTLDVLVDDKNSSRYITKVRTSLYIRPSGSVLVNRI